MSARTQLFRWFAGDISISTNAAHTTRDYSKSLVKVGHSGRIALSRPPSARDVEQKIPFPYSNASLSPPIRRITNTHTHRRVTTRRRPNQMPGAHANDDAVGSAQDIVVVATLSPPAPDNGAESSRAKETETRAMCEPAPNRHRRRVVRVRTAVSAERLTIYSAPLIWLTEYVHRRGQRADGRLYI